MTLRRIVLIVAIAVFGGVPAALAVTADPFGPVEVVDPVFRPAPLFNDASTFAGGDANGNVLLATIFRDASGDDRFAVHERCGATAWQRTVLTDSGVEPGGLKVAADGTALAMWNSEGTHYTAAREPGGAWGARQLLVADPSAGLVRFALSDTGDAVAVWTTGTAPAGTYASVRPEGGAWSTPELLASTTNAWDVAMSAGGAAVVVYRGPTPGYVFSRYRPAGGAWTPAAEVLRNSYQNTLDTLRVEFTGDRRTVAVADFREFDDTIRWNVGTAGAWGPTDRVLDDDGDPPATQYGWRRVLGIARHPDGLVATWVRWPNISNQTMETVVGRLSGSGWDLKVFKVTGAVFDPQLAVNAAGEILLAVDHYHDNVNEIRASIASSLSAPWPALTLASPAAVAAQHYREPFATAGGSAFAVGWGVHGGSHQRTEVVATKACAGTPTPTPTATASPAPDPLPLPNPVPTPSAPTPAPAPVPKTPVANAFVKLPAAGKCVRRGGKLTVRFPKPPTGYRVRSVRVKLASKTVATLKGKALRKPYYLRKLPKKAFTVTVSVKLTNGKSLTEKRRYTVCK